MEAVVLLEITKVVDDSTGIWGVGELEFGRTGYCSQYLEENQGNRQKLVDWLRWLADACENKQPPFGSNSLDSEQEIESIAYEDEK